MVNLLQSTSVARCRADDSTVLNYFRLNDVLGLFIKPGFYVENVRRIQLVRNAGPEAMLIGERVFRRGRVVCFREHSDVTRLIRAVIVAYNYKYK